MRIYIAIGLIVLLGPVSQHKVSADLYGGDRDLYWEDYGSGDGPELTHIEGSGHGTVGRGPYDPYDDTETEGYDDWTNYDDNTGKDEHDEETPEGSGNGLFDIDDEEEDVYLPEERPTVKEDIVKERPKVDLAAPPSTTPQPTYTEDRGMDTIQIHTTKTDDRQVSIFAQPGILAAFIGGAVVGLLCAILLVMFIVYRMRKKDEGSYPLDEPKRMPLTSSYSPNDKEIYA
ncbi:syndecan-like [Penaeus indicus]|uniref:syndecan-like n=1 Tax=Penaeus indicus TaxID=29960 RepID=UPI00300D61B6